MAETEKTAAMLLDDLAAWICRSGARWPRTCAWVAENFAGVPDGRNTAHTLRLLAHILDPC